MTEDDARNLLLVRAVELADREEALLTREDREQANAAARAGDHRGAGDERRYLARRANFAAGRLGTRKPRVAKLIAHTRWPTWLNWAVPLAALVLGLLTNEIDSSKRLNIIAFPLIGMFAWNLAVYASIAAQPIVRAARSPAARSPGGGWLARIAGFGQRKLDGQDPLTRALTRFAADWAVASRRLTGLRGARTLHLGAALFAAGVIAGMYWRALGIEYRAGWESTFLGPGAVHGLLTVLLAPASALTGIGLPDLPRIAAIRWTSPIAGGENAAPWIHMYAATAAGFVILPRLVLAGWSALGVFRLRRAFPVPGREDFYVRRLLRAAGGTPGEVRVTPYAYTPAGEARHRLEALLGNALGQGARIAFDTPAAYGSEEGWLAGASLSPATDHHLVLFNLASTPERENHGAFVAGLAARLAEARTGTALAVMLDEAGYRRRLGAQAGAEERLEQRRATWRQALAPVVPFALDLDTVEPDDAAFLARLEAALIGDAELAEVRR
jgi:hypothetical protein